MDVHAKIEFIRNNPACWTRLGFGFDPPVENENGEFVLFENDFNKYLKVHKEFFDAGVKIHSTLMPSGWMGVDRYNYTVGDRIMNELFSSLPDIYYIPRIKLNAPLEWCRENPEDVFVYSNGPGSKEEIQALVGTLKQDILGYNSAKGYAVNGGAFEDTRPNLDGVIALQSFSSPKWLKDAGEALKKIVEHIENGPYAERVIGYHIAFGACGETVWWGTWDNDIKRRGDFGITATKEFLKYSQEHGQSYDKVPSGEDRYSRKEDLKSFFYSGDTGKGCGDYARFTADMNVNAIEHFGKIVRENAPDKVIGIFYGYILGNPNAAYSGHLGVERIANSPYVDFISAPKGYYDCGPCGPGMEQAPFSSFALSKLWVDEIDNKTHLHPYNTADKPKDFEQTRAVLMREFSKNLSFNQGYWWMDLGGECYSDQAILADIRRMNELSDEIRKKPCIRAAEVLILIDDKSMLGVTPSQDYQERFVKSFVSRVKQCGTLVDLYRLSDIRKIDLGRYKALIFLNAFGIDRSQELYIKENASENALLIWNYAAGIMRDGSFNMSNVKEVTGFEINEYEREAANPFKNRDFPLIYIKSSSATECIKSFDDRRIMIGKTTLEKNRISVLCAQPELEVEEIYDLFKEVGVHMYADAFCTVYGDNRFIYVIAGRDTKGLIRFGEKRSFVNVVTGDKYVDADELPIVLNQGNGIMLRYID